MRRCIGMALALTMILSLISLQVFAKESVDIIILEDGSYITIQVECVDGRAASSKSGSKTYEYHASDGTLEWKAVLYGSFTYTGTSATCTSSTCNVTVSNSAWYTVSKTTGKNGAAAVGTLVMGRKVLGVTVAKETLSMKLTCDANGKLS